MSIPEFASLALLSFQTGALPAPAPDPRPQFDPGFRAYTGCGRDGKAHSQKDNEVIRENGILKIVRICRQPAK